VRVSVSVCRVTERLSGLSVNGGEGGINGECACGSHAGGAERRVCGEEFLDALLEVLLELLAQQVRLLAPAHAYTYTRTFARQAGGGESA
jgi:hypothetical protein